MAYAHFFTSHEVAAGIEQRATGVAGLNRSGDLQISSIVFQTRQRSHIA
jgi:hypothetical protein